MASDKNQVLKQTAQDLDRIHTLVSGNSLSGIRQAIDNLTLWISQAQIHLVHLRGSEAILKHSVYNNLSLEQTKLLYYADDRMLMDPLFAYELSENSNNPSPQATSYNKNKLRETTGIKRIKETLSNITYDIQLTQQKKLAYEKELKKIQDSLSDVDSGSKKPSYSDLDKDRIARARVNYIQKLLNTAIRYRGYSSDSSGNRAYSQNSTIVNPLLAASDRFKSIMRAPGMEIFQSGDAELDMTDPGSTENILKINEELEKAMAVSSNSKVDESVTKAYNILKAITSDPVGSKNVVTKPDDPIPEENSVRAKTLSIAKDINTGIEKFGVKTWTLFDKDLKKLDAIKKFFSKEVADAQSPLLPPCPNALSGYTDADKLEIAYTAQDTLYENEGARIYQGLLSRQDAAAIGVTGAGATGASGSDAQEIASSGIITFTNSLYKDLAGVGEQVSVLMTINGVTLNADDKHQAKSLVDINTFNGDLLELWNKNLLTLVEVNATTAAVIIEYQKYQRSVGTEPIIPTEADLINNPELTMAILSVPLSPEEENQVTNAFANVPTNISINGQPVSVGDAIAPVVSNGDSAGVVSAGPVQYGVGIGLSRPGSLSGTRYAVNQANIRAKAALLNGQDSQQIILSLPNISIQSDMQEIPVTESGSKAEVMQGVASVGLLSKVIRNLVID